MQEELSASDAGSRVTTTHADNTGYPYGFPQYEIEDAAQKLKLIADSVLRVVTIIDGGPIKIIDGLSSKWLAA